MDCSEDSLLYKFVKRHFDFYGVARWHADSITFSISRNKKSWPSSSEPATADSHEPRDNILQHSRIIRCWCRFVDVPFSIRISSSPIFIVSMHVRWGWKIAYSQNRRLFECGRRHSLPYHYTASLDAIIYHVRKFSANVNLHRRLRNVGRMSVQRFGPHTTGCGPVAKGLKRTMLLTTSRASMWLRAKYQSCRSCELCKC